MLILENYITAPDGTSWIIKYIFTSFSIEQPQVSILRLNKQTSIGEHEGANFGGDVVPSELSRDNVITVDEPVSAANGDLGFAYLHARDCIGRFCQNLRLISEAVNLIRTHLGSAHKSDCGDPKF